jgi:hypothetical protein
MLSANSKVNSSTKTSTQNEGIADIMKCIKWNLISLDGLLEFILTESKLILSFSEIQNLVVVEFQRRFKEEFGLQVTNVSNINNNLNSSTNNDQQDVGKAININKKSGDFGVNYNIASSNNNTETTKKSFTSEFILKLISKYWLNKIYKYNIYIFFLLNK